MLIEEVISNFPVLTADAVAMSYRPNIDAEPELVWVNDSFCSMFRADRLDLLGRHPGSVYHKRFAADFDQIEADAEAAGKESFSTDTLCLREDGSQFWANVLLFLIADETGTGRHAVVQIRDIDDLKNREQNAELALIEHEHLLAEIEAAQTRLISAIETTTDPFVIFDARDRLVIWNPAYASSMTDDPNRLTKGMKHADVLRVGAEDGRFPEAVGREDDWIAERLEDWKNGRASEFLLSTQDREYKVIRTRAPNGDRVMLQVDISDFLGQQRELKRYAERLEQANQEISHQALHDELTGLGNRRYLNMKLSEMIGMRQKFGGEIAALHLDLDRFKQINDTMGHAAGDHVLCSVADALRVRLRSKDVVARTGGDEFVVLVPCKANSDEPEILAERLVEALSKPVMFEGRLCRFGTSIGIARTPLIDEEELLTSSDVALYKAKMSGRSRVAIFDHLDLAHLRANKRLGDDILRGLEHGEFVAAYQPQINPFSNEIVGFEALARWKHPRRGLLLPSDFLQIAAEIQVDGQIDAAIFRGAVNECRTAFATDDAVPNLSFNVSQARLVDPDLISDLDQFEYPGTISLELIETIFFEDESETIHQNFRKLRDMGIKLEVDDFGSGRASIVALRRLAPDRLKIDRRLIQPITDSTTSLQLVRSIVDIGRTLDIGVTAEGVETPQQVHALQNLGCDRLQGFHYAKPMLLAEVLRFLSRRGLSQSA
ncbi:MAG: EAL domain-containing protein [Silicimonas sp.]|nr:EAL domain-containing protein [Silicimonas sp.]